MDKYIVNGQEAPSAEVVDALFPSYTVEMLIGVGGAGAVYYAQRDGVSYALKLVIGTKTVRTMLEFRSEAESMSAMEHPNIVKVHEYGEVDKYPYIIMDYIERGTLHEVMNEFTFEQRSIASMAMMLCEAMIYAHDKGYIHRDIKPDNVMISTNWNPKIMDFGLAINLNDKSYNPAAVGSKGYAAPEVTESPENIDQRVDVYALGGVLYYMLAREVPNDELLDLSKLTGSDPRFKMIIKNAMQKDVGKRTASVTIIRDKLINMIKSWDAASEEIK